MYKILCSFLIFSSLVSANNKDKKFICTPKQFETTVGSKEYTSSHNGLIYTDTVMKKNNIIEAWTMKRFTSKDRNRFVKLVGDKFSKLGYGLSLVQFDIEQNKYRDVTSRFYTCENQDISKLDELSEWKHIVPNSNMDNLLQDIKKHKINK